RLAGNRSGHYEFSVGRDIGVVHGALDRNGLDLFLRRGVDHVDEAGRGGDRNVDALAVLADRDVVGMAGERDALRNLESLLIDDIERALPFITNVVAAAVGSGGGAVIDLDAVNGADHFVRSGIDDGDIVAGAIGLDDAH